MDTFLYLTQANKIRTKLLLHCQSEIAYYKYNKTRINSKLSSDLYSKYDSIEIVIVNPLEQGAANHIPNHHIERKQSNSSVGTPCLEEIGNFVINLNRTLCSERKMKHNGLINLNKAQYHTQSSQMMHKKKISQMKKSCQFLRRLSSIFILRNTKSQSKSRKMSNQRVTKPSTMCFDFQENEKENQYGIATQRYNSNAKFNLNEPIIEKRSNKNKVISRNSIYQNHQYHSAKKHKTTNIFRTNTFAARNKNEEDEASQDFRRITTHMHYGEIESKYSQVTIEEENIENTDQELKQIKCFITNGRSLPFNFKNKKTLF